MQPNKRRLRFGRWGLAENPAGYQVVTDTGRLYDVLEAYLREGPAAVYMLRVRHFNGDQAPDIAATAVWVLNREWETDNA
jgi:hypothetical protein